MRLAISGSAPTFHGLAAIMRDFCGGNARTTVDQNLVLRWVRNEAVYDVYSALRDLGLAAGGADRITDVVSCPGTDSCKLGITASMGLNEAIQERIENPLSKAILEGRFAARDTIRVDVVDGRIDFERAL